MKVDTTRSVRSSPIRKGGKTSSARAGAFAAQIPDSPLNAGVSGSAPINPVGAIFAVQGPPDSMSGRAKGILRGEQLLDLLDEIKLGLLAGGVSKETLQDIARILEEKRGELDDPRLIDILNEVDLRAHVELAKLSFVT